MVNLFCVFLQIRIELFSWKIIRNAISQNNSYEFDLMSNEILTLKQLQVGSLFTVQFFLVKEIVLGGA